MKRQDWSLTPGLADFAEAFSRLALELPGRMAAICIEIEDTEVRMRVLAPQGMTKAAQDWRNM